MPEIDRKRFLINLSHYAKPHVEEGTMRDISKYKTYRKTGMKLVQKIIDLYVDRDVLMESVKLIGMVKGDTLVFRNEDETSVLMDFAVNEYKKTNKNAVELYRDEVGWKKEIEKENLDALLSSYTSLFKITSISEEENTVILNDILNKKYNIKLTDIALSKYGILGLLFFFRLVTFKDFKMTSGMAFAFPEKVEKLLLVRYKRLAKKVKSDNDSIRRFVSFYRLSRDYGIEVGYIFHGSR